MEFPRFLEHENSSPCLQQRATDTYPEPGEFNPQLRALFL
jgi:hypothetical protein